MLVQELINQLSKNVSAASRSNFKSPPQSQPPAIHKAVTPSRPSPPSSNPEESSEEPLYIITPTYRRPEQIPELTRMAHTLMLVKNIHWLVIEDATVATKQVTKLLERTGLKFDHLIGKLISEIQIADDYLCNIAIRMICVMFAQLRCRRNTSSRRAPSREGYRTEIAVCSGSERTPREACSTSPMTTILMILNFSTRYDQLPERILTSLKTRVLFLKDLS